MSLVQTDALTTSIPSPFGVSATFHIITSINLDDINQVISLNVASYMNQSSYLSGMSPLMQGLYSASGTEYQSLVGSQGFIASLYSYLATQAPFGQGS